MIHPARILVVYFQNNRFSGKCSILTLYMRTLLSTTPKSDNTASGYGCIWNCSNQKGYFDRFVYKMATTLINEADMHPVCLNVNKLIFSQFVFHFFNKFISSISFFRHFLCNYIIFQTEGSGRIASRDRVFRF